MAHGTSSVNRRWHEDDELIDELLSSPETLVPLFRKSLREGTATDEMLFHACREDSSGLTVGFLLQHFKDISELDRRINVRQHPSNNSPLHVACYRGHPRNVEALLDAGADTEALDCNSTTSYWYAVQGTMNTVAVGTREDFLEIVHMFKQRGHVITHTTKRNQRIGEHTAERRKVCNRMNGGGSGGKDLCGDSSSTPVGSPVDSSPPIRGQTCMCA
mmetsp:Transcript_17840/g.38920  ORF Transcript_17840/g.38920 Transcript_17840/m.38920 type:complete len:217 (-) Transcript_17840:774-1424(-)